jgi:Flp pilus assembly pilin Flp
MTTTTTTTPQDAVERDGTISVDGASSSGGPASVLRRLARADDGAATAEYAIVIMAAVGFAGLLVTIMRSDEVRGILSDLVRSALSVG